ncbi:MAG: DUF3301 domain-containing protein [Gammaproteobacteria bacterium]|nr:DUF3301 domain-containing protein [Gammaproteobacteria bacterium]
MTSEEIIVGLLLAGVIWFWLASLRAKEIATGIAKHLCTKAQVMLLDDSVALKGLSLARNRQGSVSFKRVFRFEFASDGRERYQGKIIMLGIDIIGSDMDAYRITEE